MPEIEQKIKQLEKAAASVEAFSTQVLNIDTIQRQPKQVQFWTGFPNFETFLSLFEFLEPRAKQMTYWRGGATDMTLNFNPNKKPGPERKLTLLNEFFLTLVRLKVGLLTEDLAHRFNISTSSTAQNYLYKIHINWMPENSCSLLISITSLTNFLLDFPLKWESPMSAACMGAELQTNI